MTGSESREKGGGFGLTERTEKYTVLTIKTMRTASKKKDGPELIKWERGKGARSQNSVDIFGDMECYGCGCQSLVDPHTGECIIQYFCERHRRLPLSVIRQLR